MARKKEGQQPRHALRQRRLEEGFSQEQLAQAIGVSTQAYSEWERGVCTPRAPGYRAYLARTLRVSNADMRRMIDHDDHTDVLDGFAPTWLDHLAALEQGASQLWTWEPVVVPGLLQTADYATMVESIPDTGTRQAAEIERRVQARLARQAVLTREPRPLELSVVLDESALHRGLPQVMTAQLEHLADAAQRPNIDLRVLPLAATAAFAGGFGAFRLFAAPQWEEPYMAVASDRVGNHYRDGRDEVTMHKRLFDHLRNVALSPSDTLDLVRDARKALP